MSVIIIRRSKYTWTELSSLIERDRKWTASLKEKRICRATIFVHWMNSRVEKIIPLTLINDPVRLPSNPGELMNKFTRPKPISQFIRWTWVTRDTESITNSLWARNPLLSSVFNNCFPPEVLRRNSLSVTNVERPVQNPNDRTASNVRKEQLFFRRHNTSFDNVLIGKINKTSDLIFNHDASSKRNVACLFGGQNH